VTKKVAVSLCVFVRRFIQRLVPNARVGIGHGQMEGKKLEELMLAFMNGEFDVLVATIIGLDVPNANTILLIMLILVFASDARSCGTKQQEGVLLFYLPPYSAMMMLEENSGIGTI
jgi:transcription-repair coupling factor (superfamily II helicase)